MFKLHLFLLLVVATTADETAANGDREVHPVEQLQTCVANYAACFRQAEKLLDEQMKATCDKIYRQCEQIAWRRLHPQGQCGPLIGQWKDTNKNTLLCFQVVKNTTLYVSYHNRNVTVTCVPAAGHSIVFSMQNNATVLRVTGQLTIADILSTVWTTHEQDTQHHQWKMVDVELRSWVRVSDTC